MLACQSMVVANASGCRLICYFQREAQAIHQRIQAIELLQGS